MSSSTGLMRFGVASLALTMVAPGLIAQQTGTIVGRTPGSVINRGITVSKVIPPKPTCDAPAEATHASDAPLVPELLFSRDFGNLVCVRHTDGQTEQFHSELPGEFHRPTASKLRTGLKQNTSCTSLRRYKRPTRWLTACQTLPLVE